MSGYSFLAPFYDRLTADVEYRLFVSFYDKLFRNSGAEIKTVLDLACGTGTLTELMAGQGYDMIGVDASPEMLAVARKKITDRGVLLLNQEMERLDLYGTVDAVVCSLDGINYAPPENLPEIFRRVFMFLEPGGIFIFDINSAQKLMGQDGEIFVDEDDSLYCVWRAEYDRDEMCCHYGMDIFAREGDLWRRHAEEHVEYIFEPDGLSALLGQAGFENVRVYGDKTMEPPGADEERIFLSAQKPIKS